MSLTSDAVDAAAAADEEQTNNPVAKVSAKVEKDIPLRYAQRKKWGCGLRSKACRQGLTT